MTKVVIRYTKATRGKHKGKFQRPSLNDYVLACRTGNMAGSGYAKKFKDDFIRQIEEQQPDKHDGQVVISWSYYEPDKRRDLDNIEFARKFIQDALVATGVIADDSQKYVVGYGKPEFHIDKEEPRVEVEITDWPSRETGPEGQGEL